MRSIYGGEFKGIVCGTVSDGNNFKLAPSDRAEKPGLSPGFTRTVLVGVLGIGILSEGRRARGCSLVFACLRSLAWRRSKAEIVVDVRRLLSKVEIKEATRAIGQRERKV